MIRYAAVALAFLLAACGDSGSTGGTPTTTPPATTTGPAPTATTTSAAATPVGKSFEVVVAAGKVVSGPGRRVRVNRGELVRIQVTSDVADEVHVHTYDKKAAVAPGAPAVLEFAATIPGVVEVELEKDHLLLFQLHVG